MVKILLSIQAHGPKMSTKTQGESGRRISGWFPKRHSKFHAVSFLLPEV
jgi:hypothetical protein